MKKLLLISLLCFSSIASATDLDELAAEFARTQSVSKEMARELVRVANKDDNTTAMRILAEIADKGINMNAPSPEWAFNWTLKAARVGDEMAAYELAIRYFKFNGTPRGNSTADNQTRGVFWLNRAAIAMVPEALITLAGIYQTGQFADVSIDVVRSEEKSLRFLRLAAAQEHPAAYYALFNRFHSPDNSRFNENELIARDYLDKCVELVEPRCLYEAAKIKFTGDEELRDVSLGLAYLQQAKQQGLKKAGLMHDVVTAMLNGEID